MKTPVLMGDQTPHFLSIRETSNICGISTSTINRIEGDSFPSKKQISKGRIGFLTFEVQQYLYVGKREGWS